MPSDSWHDNNDLLRTIKRPRKKGLTVVSHSQNQMPWT